MELGISPIVTSGLIMQVRNADHRILKKFLRLKLRICKK